MRTGLALALAERERERRRREQGLQLLAGERVGEGLQRIALGQLDRALELLCADNGAVPVAEAVHESRKALKRVRALLALLEEQLGADLVERERAALRDVGRRIATARDARVIAGTLEDVLRRADAALARRPGVAELRRALRAEAEQAEAALAGDARPLVLADLRRARASVAAWEPARDGGLEPYLPALQHVYARGRRRFKRAREGRGNRAAVMHRWRKRVKDLRHVAEALGPSDRRLRRLASRAEKLGEVLGAEHDLVVLGARVQAELEGGARGGRRPLLKAIRRRRRRLRREALRRGARLYELKPKQLGQALAAQK